MHLRTSVIPGRESGPWGLYEGSDERGDAWNARAKNAAQTSGWMPGGSERGNKEARTPFPATNERWSAPMT